MYRNVFQRIILSVAATLMVCAPALAGETWTLQSAIQRALGVAPESRAAGAEVAARQGERTAAGAWPNPGLELRADQKLGIEDATGGRDMTQLAIRQPLPITRLHHQRRQADANLVAARSGARYQGLALEQQTARAFHQLQFAAARLELARERLKLATEWNGGEPRGARRDPLVRYLAPAERARLTVLVESARQALWQTEGEHEGALTAFRALLELPPGEALTIASIEAPPPAPPPLDALRPGSAHPLLAAATAERDAAEAGIAVARASRFEDPVVSVFRERDFLNGTRREFDGVSLSVQVPLWNLNRGGIEKARAERARAEAILAARERDVNVRLAQSHARVVRMLAQLAHFHDGVLAPAQRVFALTQRGFAAGEVNVLALLDAHNTYFDARERALALLADAWLETAELQLAAGQSIVAGEVAP